MNKNIDGFDRIVRIAVGLILIGLTLAGTIGLWGWIGVVLLLTGLVSFCPLLSLHQILGINSCRLKRAA